MLVMIIRIILMLIIVLFTIIAIIIAKESSVHPIPFGMHRSEDDDIYYDIFEMVDCMTIEPRTPDEHTAVRSDCTVQDMPDTNETMEFFYPMDNKQLAVLQQGHVPSSEDDIWFYYMDAKTLYAYRMPDGYCIFTMEIDMISKIHQVTINTEAGHNFISGDWLNTSDEVLTGLLNMWIFGDGNSGNES